VLGLFLAAAGSVTVVTAGGSFQSGPIAGSLYAGGLDYTRDVVYVTGITYDQDDGNPTKESSCFVTQFESDQVNLHPPFISSRVGDGNIMESCHSINLLHDPQATSEEKESKPFVVAGTSDPGGIYGSAKKNPSGFLMALDPMQSNNFNIQAGLSLDDAGQTNKISYPVTILYEFRDVSDDGSGAVAAPAPIPEPIVEPIPEPIVEPVIDPAGDLPGPLPVDPVGDLPVPVDPSIDDANPDQQPVADPQPIAEPVADPQPIAEPVADPQPIADPAGDVQVDPPPDNAGADPNTRDLAEDPADLERRNGVIYVASLSSSDLQMNTNHDHVMVVSNNQPNWINRPKYGSAFMMTLQRINTSPDDDNGKAGTRLQPAWTTSFPIDGVMPFVDLGGMIITLDKKRLIAVGSANESGEAYGRIASGSVDIDGFIAVVDTVTGQLAIDEAGKVLTKRIGTSKDDLIFGICDDPDDPDSFYIVGATGPHDMYGDEGLNVMGNHIDDYPDLVPISNPGSMFGFVQKRSVKTLGLKWAKRWAANKIPFDDLKPSWTAGRGCKVVGDGTLYVVGIAKEGAHVLMGFGKEHNGDDIVAMNFDTSTGALLWVNQFGSADGSEDLAPSGAVAVDMNSDLVIFGHTTGSMFRKRDPESTTSDIFLATLSKESGKNRNKVIGGGLLDGLGLYDELDNFEDSFDELDDLEDSFDELDDLEDSFDELDEYPELPPEPPEAVVVKPIPPEDVDGVAKFNGGKWNEDEIYENKKWFRKNGLGIQTGPTSGALYAGGMVYNPNENALYLTGISYDGKDSQASCVLTKLPLTGTVEDFGGDYVYSKVIGSSDVLEVCNTVAMHRSSEVVVVGSADKGSTVLASKDASEYPMAGFAMAFDQNKLGEVSSTLLVTSNPIAKIEYPIDVISDGDDLYIVALTSSDPEFSREYKEMMDEPISGRKYAPNWINMKKYGTSLEMTVTKLSLKEELVDGIPVGGVRFTPQWTSEFPVDPDADGSGSIPRVNLGGTIVNKGLGIIIIAGSTRGLGRGYGAGVGNDEDGFITVLSTETGELASDVIQNQIREGTADYDIVLGICGDPNDDENFYIVGATKGEMVGRTDDITIPPGSLQGFVRKLRSTNIAQVEWTVMVGAVHKNSEIEDDDAFITPTTTKAFDCVVSGDNVYVGGVVDDNARVVNRSPLITRGRDDIFVGQINTKTGEMGWLRQAGSAGNDHIAPRGGMALGRDGAILVFGDTTGAFYRERSGDQNMSELFVMEFDPSGAHKSNIRHHKHQSQPTESPIPASSPVPAALKPTNKYVPPANTLEIAPPTLGGMNIVNAGEFGSSGLKKKEGISVGAVIGILIGVAIVLGLAYLLLSRLGLLKRRRTTSDRHSKIEVRDGLITNSDRRGTYSDAAPPPSSFLGGKAGMLFSTDTSTSYSDNLKNEDVFKNVV